MKSVWFDKFKIEARRLLLAGWEAKPAWIRAFFWIMLGIVLGVTLR